MSAQALPPQRVVADAEARARQVAGVVLRSLVESIFTNYPQLGIERVHAIVEDAARDA
jgi:hypothetical protein